MSASGETEQHRDLKRAALRWAQSHGFALAGVEVRLPRSGFRADVAACAPVNRAAEAGETAVFECKQSRADFLRDSAEERATLDRLRIVAARRAELEQLLGLHLPNLRRGDSLFAECDAYRLDDLRHDGLRRVRREETQLRAKLYGGTKFDRVRRYRCADRCYLVIAPGVLEPHEAPMGWGVLLAGAGELTLIRRPERIDSGAVSRLALLQAIAAAGARRTALELGVTWEVIATLRASITPGA